MTIDTFLTTHSTEQETARLSEAQDALRQAQQHVSITLAGILNAHWTEACSLKCDCGRLVCYDAYFRHMALLCNRCYARTLTQPDEAAAARTPAPADLFASEAQP